MCRLFVISCLIVTCSGGNILQAKNLIQKYSTSRIVGGESADISDYPYQVSFERDDTHFCGASILSEEWVVTAAHCIEQASGSNISFRAGSNTAGRGGTLHEASQAIAHPQYESYTIDFDIAVIKVSTKFIFGNNVQPISMATTEPSVGDIAVISGWGANSTSGSRPDQLQVVSVPIVDHDVCDQQYAYYGGITENMICAGEEEGGKDSCESDSGGPLAVNGKLAGIVSWGIGCGRKGYPGVYSNIAVLRRFVTDNTGVN